MVKESFNGMYCSQDRQDFILLYDGLGTYYLYYKEELLKEIEEPITPKELYKENKSKLLVGTAKFKKEEQNGLIRQVYDYILNLIGTDSKERYKVMTILKDLFRTLSDAETDDSLNIKYFTDAPQTIRDKAEDISLIAGYDTEIFKTIINPANIEDAIKQRANPVLTKEQKAKADAIAKEIEDKGLIPYLEDILDDIHLGNHKNIYRKILAVFNVMRGKGSYLIETTSKSESGKSFEDYIVFDLITPQNYIFEVNDITIASFMRYALINPNYFDRVILNFGDCGSQKSFKKKEDVFNSIKPLITEGKYKYIKSDKDNDTDIIEQPLMVKSIGAVYQTTINSFTEDDDQLISRTLFFTPAKVEPKDIARRKYYLRDKNSNQSIARAIAEEKLKDFGLFLMQMVNSDVEIVNAYFDDFWDYSSKSETPIRENDQQLELFDGYCTLTKNNCNEENLGTHFASEEQLKEYMDSVNLENALIPYEYDFLDMLLAKGKSKELTILYTDSDIYNENGDLKKDIDKDTITTLTDCENTAIEQINIQYMKKQKRLFEEVEDEIQTKSDLSPQQLKELPQKLLANYGFRSTSASQRIFFRVNDLKTYYSKRTAYKNIDNVPGLLQTLYNKGYLGKYEYKHNKENLYYLTPLCNDLKTDFKPKKEYEEYVREYFNNVGYLGYKGGNDV